MEETPVTAAPVMDTTTTTTTNNDLAIVVAVPLATNGENVSINGEKKNIKKKRSGGFSLFKAARLIFRPKPSEKPKPPAIQSDVASNGAADNWKKIVGSIRPLHLQDHPLPSPPPLTAAVDYENQPAVEQFEDVIPAPVSPTLTSSSASEGSPSVYGSAMNLQELDNHGESEDDDDEDEDQVFDDKPADAMIDAKAEEFIAHFYAQMRRQQLDSAYYHN